MYTIKYCGAWNYRPQAESLSAAINNTLPDTCEIEEGETGQFELFKSGESFIKAGHGKFFDIEDVLAELEKRHINLYIDHGVDIIGDENI